MKSINRIIFIAITFLALATSAHAQTPREQLNQMVQQLQKNPSDNALREKIIKLGMTVRPALPDEAVRYTGRAMFVFKTAKREADYLDAAREYERAVASAPWVASYYADLCTIYEKASHYAEAKRACDFALVGTTDSAQAIELKQRIAGLEIGIERNSAGAQAQRKQEEFAVFLRSIEGAVFQTSQNRGWIQQITIVNGVGQLRALHQDGTSYDQFPFMPAGFVTTHLPPGGDVLITHTFSPDGKNITRTPPSPAFVYRRVN